MNDRLEQALQAKLEIHKARAMNALAKAYASGTEQDKIDALAYCKRYSVSKEQMLSKLFSHIIREWLTIEELNSVNMLNESEDNKSVCHSHDYCDPNQAMIDALEYLGIELNIQDEKQNALIDNAWSISKQSKFHN